MQGWYPDLTTITSFHLVIHHSITRYHSVWILTASCSKPSKKEKEKEKRERERKKRAARGICSR
jgi:hypothetical protein